ncbi:MAG: hypothetical protein OCD00_10035 [Colwellia sp.]
MITSLTLIEMSHLKTTKTYSQKRQLPPRTVKTSTPIKEQHHEN